jgi:hypothetical protein
MYSGEFILEVTKIQDLYPKLSYDHRKFIEYFEPHEHIRHRDATEEYRIQYACFKYAVAKVLNPETMLEIGVRFGCSALAFLNACPNMKYIGLDNERDSNVDGHNYLHFARQSFKKYGFQATVLVGDSQELDVFPTVDFIHIDGCHSKECTRHDVLTAIRSCIPWILVDDSNTEDVFRGIDEAIRNTELSIGYFNFPATQGGNTLLHIVETPR